MTTRKDSDPVIPGWSEGPDPESRGSPMCNCTSWFASSMRPGMTVQFEWRLPLFYRWTIVVVTSVTMAIGVNARTASSLFFPPIIDEFGWEPGVTAGTFSFGFVISAAVSPLIGRLMERGGPRGVVLRRGAAI